VTRDTTGIGKSLEQLFHRLFILRNIGIDLGVGTLEVGIGHQAGSTMSRPCDVDHVEVMLLDHSIQVSIDEVQAWGGAPVTQQSRLDMLFG